MSGKGILGATVFGAAIAGMFLYPQATSAASASASLAVSASVVNNCTISTSPLAFGSYDPIVTNASADLDGAGGVTITCTKGAATTIGLNTGSNALASVRRMKDAGTNYLTYELYQEAGRTTVWTNAGAGLLTPAAAPSKAPRSFSVYGRVASNQDVPAGSYTDTITATVNF